MSSFLSLKKIVCLLLILLTVSVFKQYKNNRAILELGKCWEIGRVETKIQNQVSPIYRHQNISVDTDPTALCLTTDILLSAKCTPRTTCVGL